MSLTPEESEHLDSVPLDWPAADRIFARNYSRAMIENVDREIMSDVRKWQCIVQFAPAFVAQVGVEKLRDFARAPDGSRPVEITLQRKLTDEEVAVMYRFTAAPENCEHWLFEGTAREL